MTYPRQPREPGRREARLADGGAAASAFASPGPGHAPVMACLGAGNAVRPATIVLNKATVVSDLHGRITWGAAQLGIAEG